SERSQVEHTSGFLCESAASVPTTDKVRTGIAADLDFIDGILARDLSRGRRYSPVNRTSAAMLSMTPAGRSIPERFPVPGRCRMPCTTLPREAPGAVP